MYLSDLESLTDTLEEGFVAMMMRFYGKNDPAHDFSHGIDVASECGKLYSKFPHLVLDSPLDDVYGYSVCVAAGLIHDMFAHDRENHHVLAACWIRENKRYLHMRSVIPDHLNEYVADAVLNCRSSCIIKDSSLLAHFINAADNKDVLDVRKLLDRAVLFRAGDKVPTEEDYTEAAKHLKEKFGSNGYWEPFDIWKQAYDPTGRLLKGLHAAIETF